MEVRAALALPTTTARLGYNEKNGKSRSAGDPWMEGIECAHADCRLRLRWLPKFGLME